MMTHMKKQLLIVTASLALLSGCGGKENGTGMPGGTSAALGLATGESVYKSTCSICHKSGLKSAPRLGVKEDWGTRLTQSNEILYDHAINGFIGKKGVMPSRGSNAKLTDAEVRAAVDYMVVHAVPSWSVGN